MTSDKEPKKEYPVVGTAPVKFTGKALYFTHEGGSFEGEGVKGTFAVTVGGAAIVVHIEGGGSYECRTQDIVEAAVTHHKNEQKVTT